MSQKFTEEDVLRYLDNFVALIAFTEELVYPKAFVSDSQEFRLLVKQANDKKTLVVDDIVSKNYYDISTNPQNIIELSEYLSEFKTNIIPRFYLFVVQRGSKKAFLMMSLALQNLLNSEVYFLDDDQSKLVALAIQLAIQVHNQGVLIVSRLVKYLKLDLTIKIKFLYFIANLFSFKQKSKEVIQYLIQDIDLKLMKQLRQRKNPQSKPIQKKQQFNENKITNQQQLLTPFTVPRNQNREIRQNPINQNQITLFGENLQGKQNKIQESQIPQKVTNTLNETSQQPKDKQSKIEESQIPQKVTNTLNLNDTSQQPNEKLQEKQSNIFEQPKDKLQEKQQFDKEFNRLKKYWQLYDSNEKININDISSIQNIQNNNNTIKQEWVFETSKDISSNILDSSKLNEVDFDKNSSVVPNEIVELLKIEDQPINKPVNEISITQEIQQPHDLNTFRMQNKEIFNFQLRQDFSEVDGYPFKNYKGEEFVFFKHSEFACRFCQKIYYEQNDSVSFLENNYADYKRFLQREKLPEEQSTYNYKLYCKERDEEFLSIMQTYFDLSLETEGNQINMDFPCLFLSDPYLKWQNKAIIFMWLTHIVKYFPEFRKRIIQSNVFMMQKVVFEFFWKSMEQKISQPQNENSVNVVFGAKSLGLLQKLQWNNEVQQFQIVNFYMSLPEIEKYILTESDQVIQQPFTLYFMKLHALLHSKQLTYQLLLEDHNSLTQMQISRIVEDSKQCILVLGDFHEKKIPYGPFLKETKCWEEIQLLVNDILEIEINITDVYHKAFPRQAKQYLNLQPIDQSPKIKQDQDILTQQIQLSTMRQKQPIKVSPPVDPMQKFLEPGYQPPSKTFPYEIKDSLQVPDYYRGVKPVKPTIPQPERSIRPVQKQEGESALARAGGFSIDKKDVSISGMPEMKQEKISYFKQDMSSITEIQDISQTMIRKDLEQFESSPKQNIFTGQNQRRIN